MRPAWITTTVLVTSIAACDFPTKATLQEPLEAQSRIVAIRFEDGTFELHASQVPGPEVLVSQARNPEVFFSFFSVPLRDLELNEGLVPDGPCGLPLGELGRSFGFLGFFATDGDGTVRKLEDESPPPWLAKATVANLDLRCRCGQLQVDVLREREELLAYRGAVSLDDGRHVLLQSSSDHRHPVQDKTWLWVVGGDADGRPTVESAGEVDGRLVSGSLIDDQLILVGRSSYFANDGIAVAIDPTRLSADGIDAYLFRETLYTNTECDYCEPTLVLDPDGRGRLRVATSSGVVYVRTGPDQWNVQTRAVDLTTQPHAPIVRSELVYLSEPGGSRFFAHSVNRKEDDLAPTARFFRTTADGLQYLPLETQLLDTFSLAASGVVPRDGDQITFSIELPGKKHLFINWEDGFFRAGRSFRLPLSELYSFGRFRRGPHEMLLAGSAEGKVMLIYEDGPECDTARVGGEEHIRRMVPAGDRFVIPRRELMSVGFDE